MKANRNAFRPKACVRCRGDAYLESIDEEPEWRCIQCGRLVPVGTASGLSVSTAVQAA